MRASFLSLALVFLLSGNGNAAEALSAAESLAVQSKQAGVMAIVNGQPITLHQVESLYDMNEGAAVLARSPSVELLQEQYGASLAALIVNTLLSQELEKRGFPITDDEARSAEEAIRSDYPEGEFENMLQEEYIELAPWRDLLRRRLAVQRFQERVLRPRFSISQAEIEAQYAANKDLLQQPEKVDIFWIQDTEKANIEARRAAFVAGAAGAKAEGGTGLESLRIGITRLPVLLRKELAALKPGQVTPLVQEGGVWQFAVLRKRSPARKLSIIEAYPILEAAVIESKLEAAYDGWLQEVLAHADIRIVGELGPERLAAIAAERQAKNEAKESERDDAASSQEERSDPGQTGQQSKGQD